MRTGEDAGEGGGVFLAGAASNASPCRPGLGPGSTDCSRARFGPSSLCALSHAASRAPTPSRFWIREAMELSRHLLLSPAASVAATGGHDKPGQEHRVTSYRDEVRAHWRCGISTGATRGSAVPPDPSTVSAGRRSPSQFRAHYGNGADGQSPCGEMGESPVLMFRRGRLAQCRPGGDRRRVGNRECHDHRWRTRPLDGRGWR